MKKTLSLLTAFILAFCCAVPAFAATATPDEAVSVESIELILLPDKLVYDDYDIGFDLSDDDFDTLLSMEDEDEIDAFLLSKIYLDLDLSGIEVEAAYSDGTEDIIDISFCDAYVADFPNSIEDIYGDYTVVVEYMGARAEYTITVVESDYYEESNYEFVSCTPPTKDTYVFEDEAYEVDYVNGWLIDVDTTGMFVTLMNKETGELEVVDADSILCDALYVSPFKLLGHIVVFAQAEAPDGGMVPFSFEVEVISNEDGDANEPDDDVTPGGKTDPESKAASGKNKGAALGSADEATPDFANKAASNKAVNTGQVFPASIVLFIVGCGAMITMFASKRKANK